MSKVGDRVGAVLSANETGFCFLGFGTYVGDEKPVEAVGFMADILNESNGKNPCIKLDSGKKVYGCECWWGGEQKVKTMLEKAKEDNVEIIEIDIEQVREEHKSR